MGLVKFKTQLSHKKNVNNGFKIESAIKLEKTLIHNSIVRSMIDKWSNQLYYKYIIYILYKI